MYPNRSGLYDPRFEHDACGVGCVASLKKAPSHDVVRMALDAVINLTHRGAVGGDSKTGDGAGVLFQMPHDFLARECEALEITLPSAGDYGVGMVFLPQDDSQRDICKGVIERSVALENQNFLGWRHVPTVDKTLGEQAKSTQPVVEQFFVGSTSPSRSHFGRALHVIRRRSENAAVKRLPELNGTFYICSLSAKVIVYKGLLLAEQIEEFYPEIGDDAVKSALAVFHQRYSTNTFPTWPLAQPFRFAAHNGEINTLRGNINRMRGHEKLMTSELYGDDLRKLLPIIDESGSDSSVFDNVLELLVRGGRTLPHALMMMIPEAWGPQYHMSADKRAFYEYHAHIMEPWDGPAALVATDGEVVGATLDRNGLRPARYTVTRSGYVVLASETGVLEFPPEDVAQKGRLQPGHMLFVDTQAGRIVPDKEIKSRIVRQKPYRRWLDKNQIEIRGLFSAPNALFSRNEDIHTRQLSFGYTREDLSAVVTPMAMNGQEAIGSMGTDTPLAVLSERPQLLFNYFKQLFAQVTNPPIDPLRETLVMSQRTYVGYERNLLGETPEHCRRLALPHPILSNDDVEYLKHSDNDDLKPCVINTLFDPRGGGTTLRQVLADICKQAERRIHEGHVLLILSDRAMEADYAPIPSLLAASAIHQYLLKCGLRAKAGLIVESGEVRETMHFSLLLGYGVNAINPYLVFESLGQLIDEGAVQGIDRETMVDNYINAIRKGLFKTFSRMGISTLRSYCGAQIFEAIGLSESLVDDYFPGTPSRIGGINLDILAEEVRRRHERGYPRDGQRPNQLPAGGEYSFRVEEAVHLNNPQTIGSLQHAVRTNNKDSYRKYSEFINTQMNSLVTLRGLFKLKKDTPVPLDEVEPASEIVKRFVTGAMSYGSLSKESHEDLAIAMNRIGGKSNTGEGGEDPERNIPLPNGDSRRSAIKQVASGRFGVTMEYLVNSDEIQIKMAQGAKPGEGGQLPGHKVNDVIARVRHSTPGVSLISPPPHHDIYSIEDLKQLIFDLKNANPEARISVKLVAEVGVGTVAAGVSKAHADLVLISGHDGGTGASPLSSIKYAGIPWELGLAETQQVLVQNNLRDRIRVQVDGQLKTGRDVVIGALLGAEEFGFATAALLSLGCIMARKCHLNTCPVGVATQDERLRKRYRGDPQHLVNLLTFIAEEAREIMAEMGFRKIDEMIGRVDCIEAVPQVGHWKARNLDLSRILTRAVPTTEDGAVRCTRSQDHGLEKALDNELIRLAEPALERKEPVEIELPIRNVNRTVGTTLSSRLVKRHGPEGLTSGTIRIAFRGSAGQSFGAFLAPGIEIKLEGDSNDYFAKGMSGGQIAVFPPEKSDFKASENVVVGNVSLYGATGGEVFISGKAGERFGVRNSGATAVVEGVGDHGCEYMTGGRVIVLGTTGINFAAGMSGGYAYVLDENQLFDTHCNLDMVDLEPVVEEEDRKFLHKLIHRHCQLTGSAKAEAVMKQWANMLPLFVKVVPIDYRRALERMKAHDSENEALATEEVYRG